MFGNSVGPTDKPQRAEDAKLSGAMPGTAASSSTQEKERILPPKGSVWERMPDKYEAYPKVFGKRPDKVKPALAVKELDAELERLAEEKLREGMDRPNWWEADLRGLGFPKRGALACPSKRREQFIMDGILTSSRLFTLSQKLDEFIAVL